MVHEIPTEDVDVDPDLAVTMADTDHRQKSLGDDVTQDRKE